MFYSYKITSNRTQFLSISTNIIYSLSYFSYLIIISFNFFKNLIHVLVDRDTKLSLKTYKSIVKRRMNLQNGPFYSFTLQSLQRDVIHRHIQIEIWKESSVHYHPTNVTNWFKTRSRVEQKLINSLKVLYDFKKYNIFLTILYLLTLNIYHIIGLIFRISVQSNILNMLRISPVNSFEQKPKFNWFNKSTWFASIFIKVKINWFCGQILGWFINLLNVMFVIC